MFSKELQQLDRNTVQYMIDEMQKTIEQKEAALQKAENEKQLALAQALKAENEKQSMIALAELERLLREKLEFQYQEILKKMNGLKKPHNESL